MEEEPIWTPEEVIDFLESYAYSLGGDPVANSLRVCAATIKRLLLRGHDDSARYIIAAFCKANGGEAYISAATLAALGLKDEIERRDEPDGGIYYRLVSTGNSAP